MPCRCFLLTLVACLCSTLAAKERIGLYIDPSAGLPPLRIERLSISVEIVGQVAVTNLEFAFRNETDRLLEGEFILPLADGQEVYRLALDIDGQLRDASIVASGKGRQAFEQVVRELVDPALLEKDKGSRYALKIYPIPPKGTRLVSIGVEQPMLLSEKAYRYNFPLEFSGLVDAFKLDVRANCDAKPHATVESPSLLFESDGSLHTASYERSAFASGESLQITVPAKFESAAQVFVEADDRTGEYYFQARLPARKGRSLRPRSTTVYWDTSLSSLERSLERETALLEAFILESKLDFVELIPFSISEERATRLDRAQTRPELPVRDILDKLVYDGGTRLSALDFSKAKGDLILLFSDGISSIGTGMPDTASVPLFAVNSRLSADHDALRNLSIPSGGSYIDLSQTPNDAALDALGRSVPELRLSTLSGMVAELHTNHSSGTGGSTIVSGRLQSAEAVLSIGDSKKPMKGRIRLSRGAASDYGGLIRRNWARERFKELAARGQNNVATRFAIENGIVTKLTSLIVLETAQDYHRFAIAPPPELQKAVKALADAGSGPSPEERLEEIVRRFRERIAWYERDFPLGPPKPKQASNEPPDPLVAAQSPAQPPPIEEDPGEEETFTLSPFEVEASEEQGYRATSTLSGSRMLIQMNDVASSVPVSRQEFQLQAGSSGQLADLKERMSAAEMEAWSPDAAYFKELQASAPDGLHELYLAQRERHGSVIGYYFDAASVFYERGQHDIARRVLSNVCEARPGDELFLRAVGRRLMQLGSTELAIEVLEETLELRDFEAQSYLDLGLAYAEDGQVQRAIDTLLGILELDIDERFGDIALIALMEINRLVAISDAELQLDSLDERLIYAMPLDLRVVLSWNTDDTDIDLWVSDPHGEKCYYRHSRTTTGGALSDDVTDGYGPEEFIIRRAVPGTYVIEAQYYGSTEQGVSLPPVLSVKVEQNFSRPSESSESTTVRLDAVDSTVAIGRVTIGQLPSQARK